jgi:hypothetical protein
LARSFSQTSRPFSGQLTDDGVIIDNEQDALSDGSLGGGRGKVQGRKAVHVRGSCGEPIDGTNWPEREESGEAK